MIRLRTVGETSTVPPALAALVAAGALAAIATVYTGYHEAATRKIPQPDSATVVQIRYVNVRSQPVRLGTTDARTLAKVVNNLPRPPTGSYGCGADNGRANEIQFTRGSTVSTVDAQLGGCGTVIVSSNGPGGYLDKWDPHDDLQNAVNSALAHHRR